MVGKYTEGKDFETIEQMIGHIPSDATLVMKGTGGNAGGDIGRTPI
jgi:hypothetical protein